MPIQRILFLLILLVTFSCNDDVDDDEMPINETPENVLEFFSGDVDGEKIEINVTLTNSNTSYHSHSSTQSLSDCWVDYGSGVIGQLDTPPGFDFTLLNFYNGDCSASSEQFNSLFSIGELPFANYNVSSAEKLAQCGISLTDGYYSSLYGNQSDAVFSITKVTEANNSFGIFQEIEGTITCHLFNSDDHSDSIKLTNGIFKMTLAPLRQ